MKKKIIFIVLIMYLFCNLYSPIVFAKEESEQAQTSGIFTPIISFEFTENLTDEPIYPSQTQEIEIKINFKLEMSSLAKRFFFNRRIGRFLLFGPGNILKIKGAPSSSLNISISEYPTWVSAKIIDTETFQFSFDDIYQNTESFVEKTIKLEFTVNKDVNALEKGDIEIQAEFTGRWTISGVTNTTKISITSAYVSDLLVEAESELIIPPLKNTTIPINITNYGNGDSKISIIYTNQENWTTGFDQKEFNLKVNETKQITLTINPPKDFTNQTIDFSFIPKSTAGEYEGTPVISSITFINDGSLKEEEGQEVVIVGVIILIIIILLVITFLFLGKKKQ